MKKYINYIKENVDPRFIDLLDITSKYPDIDVARQKLSDIVLNNKCLWYTKGIRKYKDEIVTTCNIETNGKNGINFYFNGTSVDTDFSIEIQRQMDNNQKHSVIGLPSGEVLYLTRDEILTLFDFKLVNYESELKWKDLTLKEVFFFSDKSYHSIKKILNVNYERPEDDVFKQEEYRKGDVVICKGMVGRVNVHDKIGKINTVLNRRYLVEFLDKPDYSQRMPNSMLLGNKLWLTEDNIKGIYIGDLDKKSKMVYDLEDHELDDDYHINQLFKGNKNKVEDNIKIGDDVFLTDANKALYQIESEEFVDVWFKIGQKLGRVVEIKDMDGEKCVKTDFKNAWYKTKCVGK